MNMCYYMYHYIYIYVCVCLIYIYIHKSRELLFPNLPPVQGHASPSRKLLFPQVDHHFTVGVIYAYICIDCQSSILSHMVPELTTI